MLQGHPIDFFFSIEAALQNGSKKLIALHKKSIFPSIDEEILKSNPTAEPAPYKTVFGPGDLYINHPTDYDYVIWFSFVNPRYFCLNTCQCVESIWDEYKVQYRKSATTQYIYYEIETFSKSLVDIKTDEDKWLYLLKNSPNSQENCPFAINIRTGAKPYYLRQIDDGIWRKTKKCNIFSDGLFQSFKRITRISICKNASIKIYNRVI